MSVRTLARRASILMAWPHFQMLLALSFLAGGTAYGQSVSPFRFSVASIKPGGDIFSTRPNLSPGRIRWTTQLCYLIGYAYHLDFSQVVGSHLGAVYAVEATFDPASTDEDVRLMIQSLLADRFQMVAHRVTAEAKGYALLIGRGGPKLKESEKTGKGGPWTQAAESYVFATSPEAGIIAVTGHNASMSQLAKTLQRSIGIPVWDRTGLSGEYDFAFRFAQDPSAEFKADAPPLSTALKEDLGLTVEKQNGPVETLVVDSIAAPSEN